MAMNFDTIKGPSSRQAIDSLRGYQYQIVLSAIAWCQLRDNEVLFLEIAEDYARVLESSLAAHQIKHSKGNITSNSPEVVQTIDSLFELQKLNPDHDVVIRHLTTATIAKERKLDDQAAGRPTLEYWVEVAKGADVAPLRARLLKMGLGLAAQSFVTDALDEELRKNLVRRIDWIVDQPGLDEARERLRHLLIYHGDRRGVPATLSTRVLEVALDRTMRVAMQHQDRRLSRADFLECFDGATSVVLPADTAMALLGNAGMPGSAPAGIVQGATRLENLLIDPGVHLARRATLETTVTSLVAALGTAWLRGGAGYGKTTAAAALARSQGGPWRIARLRGMGLADQAQVLKAAAATVALDQLDGLILDDLMRPGDPTLRDALAALADTCCRSDCSLLVTSQDSLGARMAQLIGIQGDPEVTVGALNEAG